MSEAERRFPKSLIEFQDRFATNGACAEYLFKRRWPEGFVCPGCGEGRAWWLKTKAFTYECAACGRQTSVTAGTIMHASKFSLTSWFWAAFLMATHSNGISALQLQSQLGLGSYRTAWMLCAKLHRAITVGPMAAHIVLPWTHRLFANLKRWGLGVYHGLRRTNLQHYLDEFVFRFNRRRTRHAAFNTLLGIGARTVPAPYHVLIRKAA